MYIARASDNPGQNRIAKMILTDIIAKNYQINLFCVIPRSFFAHSNRFHNQYNLHFFYIDDWWVE